jgi:hypothetical protein
MSAGPFTTDAEAHADSRWEQRAAACARDVASLPNTDGMRRTIRLTTGMPEPVTLVDTGSGGDRLRRSLWPRSTC